MSQHQIHTPDSFRSMPWRNGLGHTIELLTEYLPQSSDFAWRLSMADVVNDGLFSDFSGYDRTLLLLQGRGLTLDHSKGDCDELVDHLQSAHFKGDEQTHATLHNGPIKDFNIMSKRDHCLTTVNTLKNASEEELNICGDILLIYAPDEAISIKSDTLETLIVESKHLFQVNKPSHEKWIVSGASLIVIQIHYQKKDSDVHSS